MVVSILLCSVCFPPIASLEPGYVLTCASAVKRSKILQSSLVPSMSAFCIVLALATLLISYR